jgi:hypothetical protein
MKENKKYIFSKMAGGDTDYTKHGDKGCASCTGKTDISLTKPAVGFQNGKETVTGGEMRSLLVMKNFCDVRR